MAKRAYRVRNWPEYNQALISRGSLCLWIDHDSAEGWLDETIPEGRGRPKMYSDQAISSLMNLKAAFRLTYRSLVGMVRSLVLLSGLPLSVPCYQQIQRRATGLSLNKKVSKKRPTDVVIDASGIKVYGEGEWQQERKRQKGRKKWKKIHIAVDPESGEVIVEDVTDSNCHDSTMLPSLVASCPNRVTGVWADGAYDTVPCYKALHEREIAPHIPPRMGAVTHDDEEHLQSRNNAIREIVALGGDAEAMSLWKKLTGYGRRSLVETAFSRFKRAFGERAWSRRAKAFAVEMNVKWRVLNRFTQLGGCQSYAV